MRFEWDPEKAKRNLRKHFVTFEEAISALYDPFAATFDDADHSQREHRMITIGESIRGRLLAISHTDRGNKIRIISARKADSREKRRYEEER